MSTPDYIPPPPDAPVEVDIGSAWRAASRLISQFVDDPARRHSSGYSPGTLIAISVIAAGAMIAASLNQIEHRLRVISWPE